jgi:hypothetical protein
MFRRFYPSLLTACVVVGGSLAAGSLPARAAKPSGPIFSVPLEELGYLGVPPRYLLLGDSILTVHFADDTHLLVTFTTRGLLKRLADAREDDADQNVAALLIEIPSGKVLARTDWRERDRGQYLWAIGHGRFVLRVRSHLALLDPMANLAAGKAFEEEPFLEFQRQIGYIDVAPTGDLLSIETVPVPKPKPKEVSVSSTITPDTTPGLKTRTEPPESETPKVQINFLRMVTETAPGKPDRVIFQSAGVLRTLNLIEIPATGDGYLDIARESGAVYDFDFQAHGGKRIELSPFDTSCSPRPHFVSASEFIAFGCRGSDDKQEMAGFNLHGEETWINAFPNHHMFPQLVAAPAAGRFALSRTLLNGPYIDPDNLTPDEVTAQEVSVMQNWDGHTLLKVNASPFQRAGQNFDLSPDGQSLAIIHDAKVQVYGLPPLTRKDQDAVKAAAAWAPAHTGARVDLGGKPVRRAATTEEAEAPGETGGTTAANAHAPAAAAGPKSEAAVSPALSEAAPAADQAQQQAQEPNHLQNGDPDPTQRRPPPSLYTPEYPRQAGDPKPSTPPAPQ